MESIGEGKWHDTSQNCKLMGYNESGYIDQHDESFRALHIDCHIAETGRTNQILIRHPATIASKILVAVDMQTGLVF